MPDLSLTQIADGRERIFIRGAKARGALHSADNNRPRILAEGFPPITGCGGMVHAPAAAGAWHTTETRKTAMEIRIGGYIYEFIMPAREANAPRPTTRVA